MVEGQRNHDLALSLSKGDRGLPACFDKLNTGLTITPNGKRPVRALTLISAEDAPADLKKGGIASEMNEDMRRELSALGLL